MSKETIASFEDWKRLSLNEDVTIPASLSAQYLGLKKNISDKQMRIDTLRKEISNKEGEISKISMDINNINKQLIAIETKAAQLQGKEITTKETTQEAPAEAKESLESAWEKYINEDIVTDLKRFPQIDIFAPIAKEIEEPEEEAIDFGAEADYIRDYDDDYQEPEYIESEEGEDDGEIEGEEALEGDFIFTLEIEEEDSDESIIAKIYREGDDSNWKVRIVQGNEEPLESMQFDSALQKDEVISKISEIPGFVEIKEIPTDEYEDMVDDKKEEDEIYYDDILEK